jgi:hypothetical protein
MRRLLALLRKLLRGLLRLKRGELSEPAEGVLSDEMKGAHPLPNPTRVVHRAKLKRALKRGARL